MHACHAPWVLIIRGGLSSQALAGIGAVVLSREVAIAVGMGLAAASVKAVSEQLAFQPQPFEFVRGQCALGLPFLPTMEFEFL